MANETQTTKYNAKELMAALDREFHSIVNDRPYTVHGHQLPLASIINIFEYGWQRKVNDRCGGNDKTPETKHEIATAMVRRALDGELATRANAAPGVEPFTAFMRGKLSSYLDKATRKAIAELEGDARVARLDAIFAKNESKLRPIIEKDFEAYKAEKAAKAALAASLKLDLD